MFAPRNSRPSEFRKKLAQKNPHRQNLSEKANEGIEKLHRNVSLDSIAEKLAQDPPRQNTSKEITNKGIDNPHQNVSLESQTPRSTYHRGKNAPKMILNKGIDKMHRSVSLGSQTLQTLSNDLDFTAESLPTMVHETTTVAVALRSCVSTGQDFILVLGMGKVLVGTMTSTDIVYRSLACGLDPRTIRVSQIMTHPPIVAEETTTSSDAFIMMISNNLEHLPICNPSREVVRLVHLKDVFQEYLHSIHLRFEASERLYKGIAAAGIELCTELGFDKSHAAHMLVAAKNLVNKTAMPDFATFVALQGQTVLVRSTDSVNTVVHIMKAKGTSVVCVVEDIDRYQHNLSPEVLGLCTSWDIVLHIAKFGVGMQSSVTAVTNTTAMGVHPLMSTYDVTRTMLRNHVSNILVSTRDRTPVIVNMLSIAAAIHQQIQPASHLGSPPETQTSLDPVHRVDPKLSSGNSSEMKGNTIHSIPDVLRAAAQQDTNRANYMATVGRLKTNTTSNPQLVRIYEKVAIDVMTPLSSDSTGITQEKHKDRSRVVAIVSRTEDTNQPESSNVAPHSPIVNIQPPKKTINHNSAFLAAEMEDSTRVRVMALVGRLKSRSCSLYDAPPDYHSDPAGGSDAISAHLAEYYDVFRCYLPLTYLSEAYTIRSTIRLKLTALGDVQLYELSSDIFYELLRRLEIWKGKDKVHVYSSSERDQFRRRLSEESVSQFQDIAGDVYFELRRRYPALQEDVFKNRDMIVVPIVARLTEIFQDILHYKRLLSLRESKAQRILDLFQYILDSPDLLPQFRRNLLVATQRLSSMSGLCPTCYELKDVELLGDQPVTSGGFADVYKGHLGGQTVCLKVIRLYQTSDVQSFIKRASAEAILWSQLQHPNLLPFYGLYRFNGRLCLVSPWMNQGIMTFLKNNPNVNRRLLVLDVVSGVAFLHAHDIVHGDLKGANILVNKLQRAVIADFGLSSVSDPNILYWASHSTAESKGGSVRWQAPELFDVVNDKLVHNSKATDIYALACVLYEIFTEELPFFELGKLEATVVLRVKDGGRPSRPLLSSPAWSRSRLTESLWTLMESCWVSQPEERPNIEEIVGHCDFHEIDERPAFDADMIFPPHSRYITSSSAVPSHDTLWDMLDDLD